MEERYEKYKDMSKTELTKAVDQGMRQDIENISNEWRAFEEDKLGRSFESISRRFSSKANEIINYIKKLSSDIFDINVETKSNVQNLTEKSYFHCKIESLFDTTLALEVLSFALP
jgi:hypothetical protein